MSGLFAVAPKVEGLAGLAGLAAKAEVKAPAKAAEAPAKAAEAASVKAVESQAKKPLTVSYAPLNAVFARLKLPPEDRFARDGWNDLVHFHLIEHGDPVAEKLLLAITLANFTPNAGLECGNAYEGECVSCRREGCMNYCVKVGGVPRARRYCGDPLCLMADSRNYGATDCKGATIGPDHAIPVNGKDESIIKAATCNQHALCQASNPITTLSNKLWWMCQRRSPAARWLWKRAAQRYQQSLRDASEDAVLMEALD
jgi:hypothetical protein